MTRGTLITVGRTPRRLRALIRTGLAALVLVALAPGPASAAAPDVTVIAPAPGATATGPLALGADVTDDGTVTTVKWYVDGLQVAADAAGSPWTGTWDSARIANGLHKVFAKARDDA